MTNNSAHTNSVFESEQWLNLVAKGCWHEAIVEDNGETVARMAYFVKKNKICLPPLTQTLGIWMSPKVTEKKRGNTQLSAQKEIVAKLLAQIPQGLQVDIHLDSNNAYILPFRWHDFRIEPTFSYRLNDLSDLDLVYSGFNKTVVKNLKVATKKVYVEECKSAAVLQELQRKTFGKQNRKNPYDEELENAVVKCCIEQGCGKLLVAYENGTKTPCSFAFLLYDENRCYYLLGGSDPQYSKYCSQNLVLWEAIKFASTVSKSFDFEGSMIEGIENFFRQFGGEQVTNYRITKLSICGQCADILKPRIKRIMRYKL